MLKKIILLLLTCCIVASGFAQKNKKKTTAKAPQSEYFEWRINGESTPANLYCPNDSITFDFVPLDTNLKDFAFKWRSQYHLNLSEFENIHPIKLSFPIMSTITYPNITTYNVYLYFTQPVVDTLIAEIKVDYIRTVLDTIVCQGRNITIPTNTHGNITFTDVQGDINAPWDTLTSVSGCDSLVHWYVKMDPYILEEYEISSCDTVWWGDLIITRPLDYKGDYPEVVERVFFASDPEFSCDTLKVLKVTIINPDSAILNMELKDFCKDDDMGGTFELETNFTAFDWTYIDKDSTKTILQEKKYDIELPGYYSLKAYMDTSLYEILTDLRIVNCFKVKDTLVPECDVVIPNVITPNGDEWNEILGIKKLNPERDNELTIYDRWGKKVFQQKNYKCIYRKGAYEKGTYENIEDAFKGCSRGGQKLPDGTYYYAFKYDKRPKPKTYSGVIMILR
jgi:gliding motility-associated-like protein